jgi:hypothetical protein
VKGAKAKGLRSQLQGSKIQIHIKPLKINGQNCNSASRAALPQPPLAPNRSGFHIQPKG